MNLTNAELAVVPIEKIRDYLLNSGHPDGAGKAKFFKALGFDVEEPDRLATALCNIAKESTVESVVTNPHGTKYVIDGVLDAPNGEQRTVRTVWIIETNAEIPRLVTAFPCEIGE